MNNRVLFVLNLLLALGLVLIYVHLYVDLPVLIALWQNTVHKIFGGGQVMPVDYRPQTVALSIQYWDSRPTVAVFVSAFLALSAIIIAWRLPDYRRIAMVIAMVTIVRHFYWRITETLTFDDPVSAIVGIFLFGAELYGVVSITLGFYQMYRPVHREPPELKAVDGFMPSVAILVPSYAEPPDILFRTLVGCMAIEYPNKKVYLLDDSKRPAIRQLCEELGCEYISRFNNQHAKAGNLNNALNHIDTDLIVVFDADHVPVRSFLDRTVPYFIDEKLAYVQTPQHFATPDPFQRNLIAERDIANEQDLFYHVILPGMDSRDTVTFAGSGTVFRRKALDEIGGFAVETVTEDIHTGLRLHARGWKSIYVNEDLAAGLAPETFSDFLNQRLRWARGATQVFVIENPLMKPGLSVSQKLCYFNALWYFLHGLPRVVFLMAPISYLLFGIVTIHANHWDVLSYYLCYFVVCSVAYTQVSGTVRQTTWSELYETAFCFYMAMVSIFSFFNPYEAHFKVTPKGTKQDKLSFEASAVMPQMILLVLTYASLIAGVLRVYWAPETASTILWNGFWAVYNGWLLIGAILVAVNRPQLRANPRVERAIAVEMECNTFTAKGATLNISEGGLACILEHPIPVRGKIAMRLTDWELGIKTDVEARVVRSTMDNDGKHWVSVRFSKPSTEVRRHLVEHTFTSPATWHGYHLSVPPLKSLGKLITSPMRWVNAKETTDRRVAPRFMFKTPCVVLDEARPLPTKILAGVGRLEEMSETGGTLCLPARYKALPSMRSLKIRFEWPRNDFGRDVMELDMVVVRRLGKSKNETQYAVAFPELTEMDLAALQMYLYHPVTLKTEALAVHKPKQVADFMQRHWVLTVRSKWQGVRFIQGRQWGEGDGSSWNQPGMKVSEVPFGLSVHKVPLLRGNVVPLRRKDGDKK